MPSTTMRSARLASLPAAERIWLSWLVARDVAIFGEQMAGKLDEPRLERLLVGRNLAAALPEGEIGEHFVAGPR